MHYTRLIAGAIVLLILWPVAYIFAPLPSEARHADVIMVLGPPTTERLDLAQSLIASGYSDNLIVSASAYGGPYFMERLPICSEDQDFNVFCTQSEPFTTQGEVGLLDAVAEAHGWDTAIVITFAPHVNRTRLYLERCFQGSASVLADSTELRPTEVLYEYVYQVGATAKALTSNRGCSH